jgi:opacity protein-like surface antigen
MLKLKIFRGWQVRLALAGFLAAAAAHAQTLPSGFGEGVSLWAGADYAYMQAGFPSGGNIRLQGIGAFALYNRTHWLGFEAHARFLNFGSWNGETEQNYLVGPRYTFLHSDKYHPFADFEAGFVKIQYPFSMGTGTSFAMAPGGGLDYRLNHKWAVRAAYQYQVLTNSPDFTNEPHFGIKPNGFLGGVEYRIF